MQNYNARRLKVVCVTLPPNCSIARNYESIARFLSYKSLYIQSSPAFSASIILLPYYTRQHSLASRIANLSFYIGRPSTHGRLLSLVMQSRPPRHVNPFLSHWSLPITSRQRPSRSRPKSAVLISSAAAINFKGLICEFRLSTE